MIQAKHLAQILLKLISAHLDTFMTEINTAPASWGGGPEKVNARGDLGTVNPKTSSLAEYRLRPDDRAQDSPGLI